MRQHLGFLGHYELTVRKAVDDSIVQHRSFKNVITNIGMMAMRQYAANNQSLNLNYCYLGSGANTPTVTDATMGAYLKTINTQSVTLTAPVAPDYVSKKHMMYRMPQGNPGNYSEVGCGWGNNPQGALFSRALILDENNNPSVITVLQDEYLDVVYTIEAYPQLTDLIGSFTLSGVTHRVTSRLAYATQGCFSNRFNMTAPFANGISYVYESPALGDITAYPTGTATRGVGTVTSRSVLGDTTTYGVRSIITIPLNEGNTPGGVIGALVTNPGGVAYDTDVRTQMSFDPPIPKTNTSTLTLTFSQWFGRH